MSDLGNPLFAVVAARTRSVATPNQPMTTRLRQRDNLVTFRLPLKMSSARRI